MLIHSLVTFNNSTETSSFSIQHIVSLKTLSCIVNMMFKTTTGCCSWAKWLNDLYNTYQQFFQPYKVKKPLIVLRGYLSHTQSDIVILNWTGWLLHLTTYDIFEEENKKTLCLKSSYKYIEYKLHYEYHWKSHVHNNRWVVSKTDYINISYHTMQHKDYNTAKQLHV